MDTALERLRNYFTRIDVPSEGRPGHYAFFLPNTLAFATWPNFPEAAQPKFGRVGRGCGLSDETCLRTGLGEAVERASCCAWPDEDFVSAPVSEVKDCAVSLAELTGFSTAQLQNRTEWNDEFAGEDWCPPLVQGSKYIEWCTATSEATGKEWLVPADFVLLGRRIPGEIDAVAVANSSGCAAGPQMLHAKLWAVLELLERDAIGRWWFGARKRFGFDIAELDIDRTLRGFVQKRRRKTVLLDISTDLWQPIVAAASWEPDGSRVAFGFSADLSTIHAAESALVEMLQIEIGIKQRLAQNEASIKIWCETVLATHSPFDAFVEAPTLKAPTRDRTSCSPRKTLEKIVTNCEELGYDVSFIDRTRPEFGVPVVRAIAPGLCSDKPRWGFRRLEAPDPLDLEPLSVSRTRPPNRLPLRV